MLPARSLLLVFGALSVHDDARIIILLFFFNDTATAEIYTLSLHDALPISKICARAESRWAWVRPPSLVLSCSASAVDRKSTRLNSSHQIISYAVFCLKKKITISNIHLSCYRRL